MVFLRRNYLNLRQFFRYIACFLVGIILTKLYRSRDEEVASRRAVMNPCFSCQKDLILSTSNELPLTNVYRFIRTARSSCNHCHIVIFTTEINNEDYKELARLYDVVFLSYDDYKPKAMAHLSIYSLRFLIYHQFLSEKHYDNIFICDLRDTLFQRNIFDAMKDYPIAQLFGFMESEQLTIGQCKLHHRWILSCYGKDKLMPIYNQSRSCAGSILGTYQGMMKYLSLMKREITEKPQCNDQGVHNYLIYHVLNDQSTLRITHESGFLGTLGTTEWVHRNKYGLVLNKNKQVYAVVHQFDCSKQVRQQMDREYRLLSQDILQLKQ